MTRSFIPILAIGTGVAVAAAMFQHKQQQSRQGQDRRNQEANQASSESEVAVASRNVPASQTTPSTQDNVTERRHLMLEEKVVTNEVDNKVEDVALSFHPIGTVRSVYRLCVGTPRQGLLAPHARGQIELYTTASLSLDSVSGLDGFSHIWILFYFHLNTTSKHPSKKQGPSKVAPPALGGVKVGVLATRSPHRPNPIGMTLCKLDRIRTVTMKNQLVTILDVSGLDLVDGTPVLDIKPYVPHYDTTDGYLGNSTTLPSWVTDGLETRRKVTISTLAKEQLSAILQQNPKKALVFYGPHRGDTTNDEVMDQVTKCIEEVLSIDVRSSWQTQKARLGKSQADRANRVKEMIVVVPDDNESTNNNHNEEEEELCTQQIDNLLLHFSVIEQNEQQQRRSTSKGSGAEDHVVVKSITYIGTQVVEGDPDEQDTTSLKSDNESLTSINVATDKSLEAVSVNSTTGASLQEVEQDVEQNVAVVTSPNATTTVEPPLPSQQSKTPEEGSTRSSTLSSVTTNTTMRDPEKIDDADYKKLKTYWSRQASQNTPTGLAPVALNSPVHRVSSKEKFFVFSDRPIPVKVVPTTRSGSRSPNRNTSSATPLSASWSPSRSKFSKSEKVVEATEQTSFPSAASDAVAVGPKPDVLSGELSTPSEQAATPPTAISDGFLEITNIAVQSQASSLTETLVEVPTANEKGKNELAAVDVVVSIQADPSTKPEIETGEGNAQQANVPEIRDETCIEPMVVAMDSQQPGAKSHVADTPKQIDSSIDGTTQPSPIEGDAEISNDVVLLSSPPEIGENDFIVKVEEEEPHLVAQGIVDEVTVEPLVDRASEVLSIPEDLPSPNGQIALTEAVSATIAAEISKPEEAPVIPASEFAASDGNPDDKEDVITDETARQDPETIAEVVEEDRNTLTANKIDGVVDKQSNSVVESTEVANKSEASAFVESFADEPTPKSESATADTEVSNHDDSSSSRVAPSDENFQNAATANKTDAAQSSSAMYFTQVVNETEASTKRETLDEEATPILHGILTETGSGTGVADISNMEEPSAMPEVEMQDRNGVPRDIADDKSARNNDAELTSLVQVETTDSDNYKATSVIQVETTNDEFSAVEVSEDPIGSNGELDSLKVNDGPIVSRIEDNAKADNAINPGMIKESATSDVFDEAIPSHAAMTPSHDSMIQEDSLSVRQEDEASPSTLVEEASKNDSSSPEPDVKAEDALANVTEEGQSPIEQGDTAVLSATEDTTDHDDNEDPPESNESQAVSNNTPSNNQAKKRRRKKKNKK